MASPLAWGCIWHCDRGWILWKSACWKCAATRRVCPVRCLSLGFCPKDPEWRKHQKWICLLLLMDLVHPIAWHWKLSGKGGSWDKAKYQVNYTYALPVSKDPLQEILKADLSHIIAWIKGQIQLLTSLKVL